jgi:hypothetical protein
MMNKSQAISTLTLLGGCASVLALAAACTALPARAQGFQGSGTIVSGGGSPTPDMITVNGAETVIDWAPTDTSGLGNIDFLPAGNTTLFSNNPSEPLSNYTVLNRILPTDGNGLPVSRVIELNGTVQSQIYESISSQPVTGGSIWFYSPGGIIAGPGSVFNTGSLVLTSNAIDDTGGLYGSTGEIRFRGAAGSNSAVRVMAGAQINALAAGSYVALVAPRVVQAGAVTVNGSTAYVGAEAVDIRINGGLFDINVTAGTTDANGVVHDGTTASPMSAGTDEPHRVFMVAVPKNNALTMLLSGTIGYTPAASAVQDNHAVILSAGYDIVAGAVSSQPNATASADSGFSIGASDWQSHLRGVATGDIEVAPAASSSVHFMGNAILNAGKSISLRAEQSGIITADQDVLLYAGSGATGGVIDVLAMGGSGSMASNSRISIAGALALHALGFGDRSGLPPLVGADATGGEINVVATGGQISAATLLANAPADGGYGSDRSGSARGGSITLSALTLAGPSGAEGGILRFGATALDVSANTDFFQFAPVDGGNAVGGSIFINGTSGASGALDLGSVDARATAKGGSSSSGAAGSATGGNISVSILDGTHQWTSFSGDVSAAAAYAVFGGTYGAALPGATGIDINISGPGSLAIADNVSLYAEARGQGGGASGGALRAGRIAISPHDGGSLTIGGTLSASAAGLGDYAGVITSALYSTPDIVGGTISIGAAGGTFRAAGLFANASADASEAPLVAGNATAGSVTLFSSNSNGQRGNFTLSDCQSFGCTVVANGFGASGTNGSNGTGGSILLYSSDADFSALGNLSLRTEGSGGSAIYDGVAGRSGDGQGGTIAVESRAGTGTLALGTLTASTEGAAGNSMEGYASFNDGDGGNGSGGTVTLSIAGGSLIADTVTVSASGLGGASSANCASCEGGGTTPFQAGSGQGGEGHFVITGGTATIGTLAIDASAMGGWGESSGYQPGGVPAIAGAGRGGSALLESRGGTLQIGALTIDASGTGGSSYYAFDADGGDGAAGIGGSARLVMAAGGNGQIFADSITVNAVGKGGNGADIFSQGPATYRAGTGGAGTGGTTDVMLASGMLATPSLLVSAAGIGGTGGDNGSDGAGGDAGSGTGGTARLSYLNEGHAIGDLILRVDGQGGQAGSARSLIGYDANDEPIYEYGTGSGGNGGNGRGGIADLLIDVDPAFATLTVNADGIGSVGGSGGVGGLGGLGTGGSAMLGIGFGTTSVSGAVRVSALGQGGLGGSGYFGQGGRGGDAMGGTATLALSGASTRLEASNILVLAEALGGDGGVGGLQSGAGSAGADGGSATGGAALFSLAANATAITGATLRISGDAMGGAGSQGAGGLVGGNGGNASAGSATLRISDARIALNSPSLLPSYSITAVGRGGAGAVGGRGIGGLAAFDAGNGDYALGGLAILADGIGGIGPNGVSGLSAGGLARFVNGDSGLLASGAQRLIDALSMRASGLVGGRVEFTDSSTATNGGLRINGAMSLTSHGAPLAGMSGIFVTGSANQVQVGGAAGFNSDCPLSFAFAGTGGIRAGSLTGTSGTGIDISHSGRPATGASLSAGTIQLSTPGNIHAGMGSLQAGGDITVLARQATFGSVVTTGTGAMSLMALNGLTVGTIRSAGALRLLAEQGDIVVGDLSGGGVTAPNHDFVAVARTIDLTGAFSINQATATAGNLTLRGVQQVGVGTATGNMLVSGSDLVSTRLTAGGTLTASSSTFATLSNLQSGGLLSVTATGDASLNGVASSSGDVVINAGGLAALAGTISGRAITIGSGDIAIASAAQIGTVGTLTFNATNSQTSLYIGGGDVVGGYSLSSAELGRIAAGNISINALGQGISGSPNVFLRGLTVGTGTLVSGGVLTIATPGTLRVDGAVGMTGLSGQGGLHLSAGNAIEVIAGSGSIDLRDANGGLGGVLTLNSPSVIAATLAVIGDLAGLSSLDAREQRLAQNDGVVSDAGILRAGSIQANVANSFFIQNTGGISDYADRRGFTTNSLSIATQGPRTQIAINGQIMGAAGAFVTGRETIPLASINGVPGGRAGGYAFGSKINGCLIGSAGSCTAVVVTDGRDSLESVLDPVVPVARVFGLSLIGLRDIVSQGFPPLIDEPVTGAGNDDLWERRCDGGDCGDNSAPKEPLH